MCFYYIFSRLCTSRRCVFRIKVFVDAFEVLVLWWLWIIFFQQVIGTNFKLCPIAMISRECSLRALKSQCKFLIRYTDSYRSTNYIGLSNYGLSIIYYRTVTLRYQRTINRCIYSIAGAFSVRHFDRCFHEFAIDKDFMQHLKKAVLNFWIFIGCIIQSVLWVKSRKLCFIVLLLRTLLIATHFTE